MPLDDWKAWLRFHRVSAHASYLSDAFVEQNFDFYRRTLTGAQEQKRALEASRCAGQPAARRGRRRGVRRTRTSRPRPRRRWTSSSPTWSRPTGATSSRLDWMGPETRAKALAKLALFRPKIGYPPKWRDYSSIEIDADDLIGNVRARQRLRDRPAARQARQSGRPRRVAHERRRRSTRTTTPAPTRSASRPRSCDRRSSTPTPTRRSTTAASAPSSATRSATASTTRARSTTARATSSTGGPTTTATGSASEPTS